MIRKLMLSCRAATALMEKKQREEISFSERVSLAMHTALCSACRQYERQSALMEKLFSKKRAPAGEQELDQAASALEKKILNKLDEAQ
jgi:hypothetical protein